MKTVVLEINRDAVYDEVSKTTSYIGGKIPDEHAYDRVFTTDEDVEMLERFWSESKATLMLVLKSFRAVESDSNGIYSLELELSNLFNDSLVGSMEKSLFSFFVTGIVAKWLSFLNKDEAVGYATDASNFLEDIRQKAYYKERPTRPSYN